jgi:glucosamine-6-phosphate deaminase
MRIVIEENKDAVGVWVANYVKDRIREFAPTADRPFVLGLPTGSSPIGTYQELVRLHRAGELSFEHVITFNMDEYCDIPKDHPESYHSFMWANLFSRVNAKPENVNILNGNAEDLYEECRQYEEKMEKLGGVELFLGGIGPVGHVAFNEPGSSLSSRTRVKTLAYDTIVANARFFGGDISKVPTRAVTVGVGTVLDAREVLIIITGINKSMALHHCIEQGVNHMWTVSALQMHPCSIVVCDEDATAELKVKTVKYFKDIRRTQQNLDGKHAVSNGVSHGSDGAKPGVSNASKRALDVLHRPMLVKRRRVDEKLGAAA